VASADDGLTPAEFAELQRLTPADAMRWMQGRASSALTFSWQDMWQEEHSRFFTVSRLARLDLLGSLHESLSRSVAGDLSRRDWTRDTEQLLADAGWWGEKQVQDPATGEMVTTRFDPARLKLIYDTNTRQAAAQGQWERIERTKQTQPYLRYITMRDDRVRPEHAAWDNVTLPVDDDFWKTHYPPNGWRCRCRVVSVSQKEYEAGKTPDGGQMVKDAPQFGDRDFTNSRMGEITSVPVGVDPGFGSIPAQGERLQDLDALVQEKLKSAIPAIANSAQYEGLTLESAASTYAERARLALPGNENKMPPLALSPIADPALAQLRELDLPVSKKAPLESKMLGLEHDGVRHVWLGHGLGGGNQTRELLRGQVPIEPGDIAAFPEIFNRATIQRGDPPIASDSPVVRGTAVFGDFRYEFAAKVLRHLVTPVTLYKWAIK
jgi:SPP1 gp7 family putative phage head morphogenesis protein